MKLFKILSVLSGLLFVYLAVQCLFFSSAFVHDLGLNSSETVTILARRTAMFMFGMAILALGSLVKTTPKVVPLVSVTVGITLLGLAGMSALEYFRQSVNDSILVALSIEIILGVSYILVFIKTIKSFNK